MRKVRVKRVELAFTEYVRQIYNIYEKSTVRLTSVGLAQARPNNVDAKHHGASLSERWNVTWWVTTVYVHIKLQLSKSKRRHSLGFG